MYETTADTRNGISETMIQNVSLLDKIRSKDYEYLWENLLQYPFPFICELLKIFHEDNWIPNNAADIGIYETLVEQIEDEAIALGGTYGNNSFDMTAVTCTVKTSLDFA